MGCKKCKSNEKLVRNLENKYGNNFDIVLEESNVFMKLFYCMFYVLLWIFVTPIILITSIIYNIRGKVLVINVNKLLTNKNKEKWNKNLELESIE